MKVTEKIMEQDITLEVLDEAKPQDLDEVLEYIHTLDSLFSIRKKDSQISKLNNGRIRIEDVSPVVRQVLRLCEQTKKETNGYFDSKIENILDPSGLLKGFALTESSSQLQKKGYQNFYIGIGTDCEIVGTKSQKKWRVGINNPISPHKPYVINVTDCGVSTSTTKSHAIPLYNPVTRKIANFFSCVTIIATTALDSDRFSTAAFAMGEKGIDFIEKINGVEGYFVVKNGNEVFTSQFKNYM